VSDYFSSLQDILERTKDAVLKFMAIITPKIEEAEDEHQRLYWHHIYEEEDQRLDRLNALLPKLSYFLENEENKNGHNTAFIHLLQDVSLEKFGLHNFEEHLDLALFQYKDEQEESELEKLRDITSNDYEAIKVILSDLNERFNGVVIKDGAIPTDEKEDSADHLKATKFINKEDDTTGSQKNLHEESSDGHQHPYQEKNKRLTVGSLKTSNY
jgi:hypothetical protein